MNYKMFIKALLIILFFQFLSSCSTTIGNEELHGLELPTPKPDKVLIYGVLINADKNESITGSPFLGQALKTGNPDLPITVSFSLQSNPGAIVDHETGFFYFENIEPNNMYVIVLVYGPGNFIVVEELSSRLPLVFSAAPGETVNLGILNIEE